MLFRKGGTRLVFLVGKYAIKVTRIRPFWFFERLIAYKNLTPDERPKISFMEKAILGLTCFIPGIPANLKEYRLSREDRLGVLVRTHFTLFGVLNIQDRGEEICTGDERLYQNPIWRLAHKLKESFQNGDAGRADQFCVVRGKVLLADYGHPNIEKILKLS